MTKGEAMIDRGPAANLPYRMPPPLFDARCRACWFSAAVLALVGLSFWSLDLQWAQFLSPDAARSMGRFVAEFFPPDTSAAFLRRVAIGTWETLAMSALGTVLAAAAGLLLALPLAEDLNFFAETDFMWVAKRYIEATNENWVESDTNVDLRLGVRGENWEVMGYVPTSSTMTR